MPLPPTTYAAQIEWKVNVLLALLDRFLAFSEPNITALQPDSNGGPVPNSMVVRYSSGLRMLKLPFQMRSRLTIGHRGRFRIGRALPGVA